MEGFAARSGISNLLHTVAGAAVKLGLRGFRHDSATRAFLGLDIRSASDLRDTSPDQMRRQLGKTLGACREVQEHYPHLENTYRQRRGWLARAAVSLALGRVYVSAQALLRADAGATGKLRWQNPLFAAAWLGMWGRVVRLAVSAATAGWLPWLDDASVRAVLHFLAVADRVTCALDQAGEAGGRRMWRRLEASGKEAERSAQMVQAKRELLWTCPNRVSMLILLSTLRDHNTGLYWHPALSKRFDAAQMSEALARIHRETCEELLECSFQELVHEIEEYAHQNRAGEIGLLSNWRSVRAYRSARPAELDLFTAAFFEFTLDLALAALDTHYR